jgi:hypothetical protein
MMQLRDFTLQNFSVVILLCLLVVYCLYLTVRLRDRAQVVLFFGKDSLYLLYCLFASLALVIARLGGNAGNYLAYYFELISPFLYLVTSVKSKKFQNIAIVLLSLNSLALGFTTNYLIDVRGIEQNWKEWQALLSKHTIVFNGPPFADVVYSNGGTVYDNGHTEYFHVSTPDAKTKLVDIANEKYNIYMKDVEHKISNQQFDLLMYWKPYSPGVPPYEGDLRDKVESIYSYAGEKEWKTIYGSTFFDLWVKKIN